MSKSKTAKDTKAIKCKSDHPATSRSDLFSKLVKLISLSECRGSNTVVDRHEARAGPGERVLIGQRPVPSPVTLHLASTTSLPTSSSKETLRSSSDSNLVPPPDEGFKRVQGTSPAPLDGARAKHERKSTRRKAKTTPLSEPATSLTTIPEIASVFERSSLLDLSSSSDSKYYSSEDALMDTDSIRARAAIALARAQLEHSRPASHNRRLERSLNQMMMLPNELEEYRAHARQRSSSTPSLSYSSTENERASDHEHDLAPMRRASEPSHAAVLTLIEPKDALSHRASSKGDPTLPLTLDMPKALNKRFQGLYQTGDAPPSPPPSIPLPKLPPTAPLPRIPLEATASAHKSQPMTPRRERSQTGPARSSDTYKGLPTEYKSDNEMLRHIDALMQGLVDSQFYQECSARRVCYSLPSASGRRGSGSQSMVDGARLNERPRATRAPESNKRLESIDMTSHPSFVTSPVTPAPQAHCEFRFTSLPGSAKMTKLEPVSFSYYDTLLPLRTQDGTISLAESPLSSPISSRRYTEKQAHQSTPPLSMRPSNFSRLGV